MYKKKINENYFEIIDDPKKAYWLGFIAADGYINKENTKFCICIKDLDVLEKFKKDIETDYAISNIKNYDKRTDKIYEEYSIQISNKNFINGIIKNGITHEKTDFIDIKKLNMNYFSYFVAGLFDGDGSISLNKNGTLKCNLISTEEILSLIDLELSKIGIKPLKHQKVTNKKDNVMKTFWNRYANRFLEYIYQGDKNIYMKRKYDLYIKNKNNRKSRNRCQCVAKYDLEGNFIEKYNTIKDASEKNNICLSNITSSVKKRTGYCGGFYWLYYDEFEKPLVKISFPSKNIIEQYSKDGELINKFVSINEASEKTGIKYVTISHCILGYNKTGGGFVWKRIT